MAVSPQTTFNAAASIRTAASLAASGTATYTATAADGKLDMSGWFQGTLYVSGTAGTVAATNGLRVQIYRVVTSGLTVNTVAVIDQTLAMTASTAFQASWDLPTGRYSVTITNQDATNALSSVALGLSEYIASVG